MNDIMYCQMLITFLMAVPVPTTHMGNPNLCHFYLALSEHQTVLPVSNVFLMIGFFYSASSSRATFQVHLSCCGESM
jgi:hypothetical protein